MRGEPVVLVGCECEPEDRGGGAMPGPAMGTPASQPDADWGPAEDGVEEGAGSPGRGGG